MIRSRLRKAFPDWGYLGEETGSVGMDPPPQYIWLVDPNDGTRGFVLGTRGSAVSIGLLRDREPVLGVVYSPTAPDDDGDLIAWAEGCGPLRRNGEPVTRAAWPAMLRPHCVALLSTDTDTPDANLELLAPGRYRAQNSIAYRLALAAVGDADLGSSIKGARDWDYAGGHALLRGVGGDLLNHEGEQVSYGPDGTSIGRGCFGGAPGVAAEIVSRDWRAANRPRVLRDYPTEYGQLRLQRGRAVADPALLRRGQGCLLGQLAGDALGSLVEFHSAAAIQGAFPQGIRDLADGGVWHTIAGQPTDDSELALLLGRSIVAHGGYDPESAASAYGYWYRSHPFDLGLTTSQALAAVAAAQQERRTEPLAEVAHRAASSVSQANGSLMRISSLGIWGHALNPTLLAAAARADSELTHPHPICQDACAIFVVAVAHAIRAGEPAESVYRFAVEWAKAHDLEPAVLDAIVAADSAPPVVASGNDGWVLVALQHAFYQLLHAPNLEEGIVAVVMAGGDTDTNAAIAGALLGAVHGRAAVPNRWQRLILSCRPLLGAPGVRQPRPEPCWPVDALVMAERLLLAGVEALRP
ncbi:MAG: ADP-ribosyl-[dinitrogen reductase] hydrolase [Chloroflexota bacterium]|nr:ADP-ribosyl-[dinitrogen reductase] hydrolase [Chloroflexota bacterium]